MDNQRRRIGTAPLAAAVLAIAWTVASSAARAQAPAPFVTQGPQPYPQAQNPPQRPTSQTGVWPGFQSNLRTGWPSGGFTVDEVVQMALEVNPQVRGGRERWYAATHQIMQNYAPSDPTFTYSNLNSRRGFLLQSGEHVLNVNQNLQFPGKALLQAKTAKRAAEIAHLVYRASIRDIRAQAQVAFYQILLDQALIALTEENIAYLQRVLKVTEVAYSANQVTQADFISAELGLTQAQQQLRQLKVSQTNDKTSLNVVLNRRPDEPLELRNQLQLTWVEIPLDELETRAVAARQEILEAALSEQNADTALTLAELEYAPDFTLGYGFDHWLIASFAPLPTRTQTHDFIIGFNIPVFFWLHQREDVKRAGHDLEAARADLNTIKTQTQGQVATLYRQAEFSRQTAVLYRDSLIPLAHQGFEVALVAYQNGKVDFTTLISAFRQQSDARSTYLQAINQLLAGKIALEQAVGEPLSR